MSKFRFYAANHKDYVSKILNSPRILKAKSFNLDLQKINKTILLNRIKRRRNSKFKGTNLDKLQIIVDRFYIKHIV